MQLLSSLFFKYRYWALCLGVVFLMILQIRNGNWYGDFWEHAAVTRELATHLWHPSHPQLLLDAPHHYYSLHAWAVAAFSKVTQLLASGCSYHCRSREPRSALTWSGRLLVSVRPETSSGCRILSSVISSPAVGSGGVAVQWMFQFGVIGLRVTISIYLCGLFGSNQHMDFCSVSTRGLEILVHPLFGLLQ